MKHTPKIFAWIGMLLHHGWWYPYFFWALTRLKWWKRMSQGSFANVFGILHAKYIVCETGLERIKFEELTKEITPKARSLVLVSVKRELLIKIKDFLLQQQNLNSWNSFLKTIWCVHFGKKLTKEFQVSTANI